MKKAKRSKNLLLTHRIHTRITRKKYDELTEILTRSRGIQSHSELLRYILDNQKIQLITYDTTYDKLLEELSSIRTQLRGIGVNVNQVVRKSHGLLQVNDTTSLIIELISLCQESDKKVSELFSVIENLSKQWLPE